MLGHFRTLIPSQRSAKMRRKFHDRPRNRIADGLCTMASECWSILGHIAFSMALHSRQVQKHGEACCAFDQRANR